MAKLASSLRSRLSKASLLVALTSIGLATASCAQILGLDYKDYCKPYGVGDPADCVSDPTGSTSTGGGGGSTMNQGGGGTGPETCMPGMTMPCYDGLPATTEGVGLCKGGQKTCKPDGSGYGKCEGEVIPRPESCKTKTDENCDSLDCVLWADAFIDTADSTGGGLANAIVADASGATYIAGNYRGTVTIGTALPMTAPDNSDAGFVAKIDATGKGVWATALAGSGIQTVTALALDSTGGVIAAGYTESAIVLNPDTIPISIPTGTFLVELDKLGNIVWGRGYGGTYSFSPFCFSQPNTVATTSDGFIVFGGTMCGSLNLGDGPVSARGLNDPFVAKVRASDGNGQASVGGWLNHFATSSTDQASTNSVGIDSGGDVYATGTFAVSANFGQGVVNATAGSEDTFVLKLSSAGQETWQRVFDNSIGMYSSNLYVDSDDGPVVGGTFGGNLTFGTTAWSAPAGDTSGVIFKLSATNQPKWSATFGATVQGAFVATDGSGSTYVSGSATGPITFTGPPVNFTKGGYLAKFINGKYDWGRGYDNIYVYGLSADSTGPVLTGYFTGTTDLGTGNLTSTGDGILAAQFGQ